MYVMYSNIMYCMLHHVLHVTCSNITYCMWHQVLYILYISSYWRLLRIANYRGFWSIDGFLYYIIGCNLKLILCHNLNLYLSIVNLTTTPNPHFPFLTINHPKHFFALTSHCSFPLPSSSDRSKILDEVDERSNPKTSFLSPCSILNSISNQRAKFKSTKLPLIQN